MRGLWMGRTSTGAAVGHEVWIAIAYCAAILAIAAVAASRLYTPPHGRLTAAPSRLSGGGHRPLGGRPGRRLGGRLGGRLCAGSAGERRRLSRAYMSACSPSPWGLAGSLLDLEQRGGRDQVAEGAAVSIAARVEVWALGR